MKSQAIHEHETPPVARDETLLQLERVLSSRVFADSLRLQAFLRYVVDETLAGNADRIKGVTIAQTVFERHDLEDAQTSTIVRVEAGRLRRRLNEYYADEGSGDPLRISIPKGRYVPCFEPLPPSPGQHPDTCAGATPARPDGTRLFAVSAGALALIALLWAMLAWRNDTAPVSTPEGSASSIAASKPSVAVLPFEDATTGGYGRVLASGLTESITTGLYKFASADVISLSSVLSLETEGLQPEGVARRLQVTHVLRGSVRGEPPSLRVTAQLYDVATGKAVWAEHFDRQLGDLLALQDDLTTKVMLGLSSGLLDAEPKRARSPSPASAEAGALFEQAMEIANPPSDAGRLQVALQAFRNVMEIDPDYAGGYAGAAYVRTFFAFWGHSQTPDEDLGEALDLATKAIERNPDFGLSYSVLGFAHLLRREYEASLAMSGKAIAAEPNNPVLNAYHGVLLSFAGDPEAGLPYAQRALRLEPVYPRTPFLNILGVVNFNAGRHAQALEAFDANIRRGGPDGPGTQVYRAASLWMLNRKEEARTAMQVVSLQRTLFDAPAWLRRVHRRAEDVEKVLAPFRDMAIDLDLPSMERVDPAS